jgi:hypothetical protein
MTTPTTSPTVANDEFERRFGELVEHYVREQQATGSAEGGPKTTPTPN